ncbi:unnamed protein product, partial [Cuscuta epithymum]
MIGKPPPGQLKGLVKACRGSFGTWVNQGNMKPAKKLAGKQRQRKMKQLTNRHILRLNCILQLKFVNSLLRSIHKVCIQIKFLLYWTRIIFLRYFISDFGD